MRLITENFLGENNAMQSEIDSGDFDLKDQFMHKFAGDRRNFKIEDIKFECLWDGRCLTVKIICDKWDFA